MQIRLDESEYLALKKVEKLLENAVAEGKKSAQKIEDLQQEKIDLLETNEKVVTIINIKRTRESKATYLSLDSIVRRIQDQVEYRRSPHLRGLATSDDSMFELFNTFFETKIIELEGSKTVTRRGLDEVTTEIRRELERELDEETKRKLSQLERLITSQTGWNKELQKAVEFGKIKDKEAEKLSLVVAKCNEDIEGLTKQVAQGIAVIKTINDTVVTRFMWASTYKKKLLLPTIEFNLKKLKAND